jgi:hypothetical protein
MSYFLVFLLVCVLAALASAGYFLITGKDDDSQVKVSKMTWALTIRIGLSVLLFVCLLISWKMGWIAPTGIRT